MRGIIEKELGGKKRYLHFGNEMLMLLEDDGIALSKLNELLRDKLASTVHKCIHHAALAYCRLNRKEPDFDKVDVSNWIDELGGTVEALNIITDGLKSVGLKNQEALEEQG